jgi:hypothetical protein|tara:strand:- start:497 stop:871 length:375 start_codon:yes stop_codon:yes gene_type:complete
METIKTTREPLKNGYWLHTSYYKDGSTHSFKFIKYWHPYELRHTFRDYAANSPKSYIRLGQKLNSIGLCIGDNYTDTLKEVLDGIERFISMNAKPFRNDAIDIDKRTLKQIYDTAKNFRNYLED